MDLPIDDVRIKNTRPLIQPAILTEEIARTLVQSQRIAQWRREVEAIVKGTDQRILVVAGPCSIHSADACLEYAAKLKELHDQFSSDLFIIMRAYFEKPRTVGGWKGLINDPELDGTHKINTGLRVARGFLRDLAELGIPAGTEFLDTTVPQHIADFITWGAIGARTVESQTHRELASGLSMPIGFKNATDGRIQPAVDAVLSAERSHWFPSTTKDGVAALSETTGNDTCHIILRGGQSGPNFETFHVAEACERLTHAGLRPSVMVDCSHGNSGKDYRKQPAVCDSLISQIASGSGRVFGVMIESHLEEGRQDYVPGRELLYGQSITDSCVNLAQTVPMLEGLAYANQKRLSKV
ncbi:MAG: 3-deoxy-7-phosphoheptulonate synthase [Fimbriimonadaceae bacterium]|nr:3-deoxy-7-phosphoheptulonate synthase [Fimbriimonadaceae bacterium]